ncbi:MAG TPA: hypothetical protein VMT81_02495 [Candidatus Paceibacterota bacterium]|nr:hypothetical protein [Candidatus Paceibacterota bacterium]
MRSYPTLSHINERYLAMNRAKRHLRGSIITDEARLATCRAYYETITAFDYIKRRPRHTAQERADAFDKICAAFQITGESFALTEHFHFLQQMIWASEKAIAIQAKGLIIGTRVLARQTKALSEITGVEWNYDLKIRYLDDPDRVNQTSSVSPFEVEKVGDVTIAVKVQRDFEQLIQGTGEVILSVSATLYGRLKTGDKFIPLSGDGIRSNMPPSGSYELLLKTDKGAVGLKAGQSIVLIDDSIVIKVDG